MARIHGEAANFTLNGVSIEDELNSIDHEVHRNIGEVTAFADVAETFVGGKYGWSQEIAGSADFDAAQGDATLFAMAVSAAVAVLYDPVGGGTAGATNNPVYGGNVLLENYKISSKVNAPVTYSASLRGTGTLARDVTP